MGSTLHYPNASLVKLAHPEACMYACTRRQEHLWKCTPRWDLGKKVTHAHTRAHTQLHRGRQAAIPTHVFVVKKPLSGTGGRPYFCEDELDPTYLHFVLSSHFSGSSWAEFGIGVGWASHPALSKAQGHGPGGTPTSLREKRKQDKWVPL